MKQLAGIRSTWRLASWRGIPLFLHWTILIGIPWFLYDTRDVFAAAVAFAAFCGLMLVHELGHAAVALWRRVDVLEIQLLLLHGYCQHDQPDYEVDDVLIAWGGVAAQAVVLLIAWSVDALLGPFTYGATYALSSVLIEANLVILVINLVPVSPLDGAKAWRIVPLLAAWATETPLAMRVRALFAARSRARAKKIEAKSQRTTADIIVMLQKRRPDRTLERRREASADADDSD